MYFTGSMCNVTKQRSLWGVGCSMFSAMFSVHLTMFNGCRHTNESLSYKLAPNNKQLRYSTSTTLNLYLILEGLAL